MDQPDDAPTEKKRPLAITIICVIGFIGAMMSIPTIFTDAMGFMGSWYPPYFAFTSVVGLVCMLGLWKMKKWAAYAYFGLVALNQVVFLAMGIWGVRTLIFPGIILGFILLYLNDMD